MDLQSQKIELIQLLLNTNEPSVISKVRKLLLQESKKNDFWEELNPKLQSEINKSIAQADNGDLISHKEVMSKYIK